jgi:ABC-type nitrate/sulfonate/bicarbonate transport system substrate-binding protein
MNRLQRLTLIGIVLFTCFDAARESAGQSSTIKTSLTSGPFFLKKPTSLAIHIGAYAEAMHYFLTNAEGAAQIVARYTKVEDRELNAYAIESESKAMERTLQVDPKGIELILQLIGKTVPQAASAKPEDFYDARFYTELRDSGFLKRLWGEKP